MHTASFLRDRVVLTRGHSSFSFKCTWGSFAVLAVQLQLFINLLKLCVQNESFRGSWQGCGHCLSTCRTFFHRKEQSWDKVTHRPFEKKIPGSFFLCTHLHQFVLVYQQTAEWVGTVLVYTICTGVSEYCSWDESRKKIEEKYSFSSVSHNPALCCRPLPSPSPSPHFSLFSALCVFKVKTAHPFSKSSQSIRRGAHV